MAVDYPAHLRLAIQQGKKRTISKTFMNASPLNGVMYSQRLTDQAPVIWDLNLIFNSADAADFSDWFISDTDSGNEAINMPIKTEQGIVIHEVRFIDIPQAREVGETWRYSCSVQAAKVERPDSLDDLINIINLGYVEQNLYDIDGAVNMFWPSGRYFRRNSGDGNYITVPEVALAANYIIEFDIFPETDLFHILSKASTSRIYYEDGQVIIQSGSNFSTFYIDITLSKMSHVKIQRVGGDVSVIINDVAATPALTAANSDIVYISNIAGKFSAGTYVSALTGIISDLEITDAGAMIRQYPIDERGGITNVRELISAADGTIIGGASGDKGKFKKLSNGNFEGINLQSPPWMSKYQLIEVL
mgnify:CR=1 FL=1